MEKIIKDLTQSYLYHPYLIYLYLLLMVVFLIYWKIDIISKVKSNLTNVSENKNESCIDDLISELNKETSKNIKDSCDDSDIVSTIVSENKYESCIKDIISELDKTLKNEVKYWNVDIIS